METNSSGKLPSTWQEEVGREAVLGLLGCFFSLEAFDYDCFGFPSLLSRSTQSSSSSPRFRRAETEPKEAA